MKGSIKARSVLRSPGVLLAAALLATAARSQTMNMPSPQPSAPGTEAATPHARMDGTPGTSVPQDSSQPSTPDADPNVYSDDLLALLVDALGSDPVMDDAPDTSWQPDSAPMDGSSTTLDAAMAGGDATGAFDDQSAFSLDPFMGASGYPLLPQTGETADGVRPLIDRQHPQDFLTEIGGIYTVPLTSDVSAFVYLGDPGEPALGPATFTRRFSGIDNPVAPVTHHWLDSTNVTYGVVTAGLAYDDFKLEGSLFDGRTPDQFHWGFDPVKLDSGSGRLTWNVTSNWSAQVSYGFVKSPGQLEPDVHQHRLTTSATYNLPLAKGNWQTTLAWGRNTEQAGPTLDGYLVESDAKWNRNMLFARAESAQNNELFQAPRTPAGSAFQGSEVSLGYVYDTRVLEHMAAGIGVAGTVDFLPPLILRASGSNDPVSFMTFIHLKT